MIINNDAVTYLMNLAMENNISVLFKNLSPITPPASSPINKRIFMNTNWHNSNDIPIQLAHELGHILNGDENQACLYYSPSRNGIEGKANKTGIKLLMKPYLDSKEKEDVSSADFMTIFHLPISFEGMVI